MAEWRAEREAAKAQAKVEAPPQETLDLSKPKEEQNSDEDINWRMDPEALFIWNGYCKSYLESSNHLQAC